LTRGGSVKRTRCVSTRLTPQEWAEWDQRRKLSGRREMGAWVRAVVSESQGIELPQSCAKTLAVPEINRDAYRQLVGAANNLNQIARSLHLTGRLHPEFSRIVEGLREAAKRVTGR
jgi:hypothetical protein